MSFSGTKGYITKPKPGVMLNPMHPLSRGLVGYWLFNEGSGSRANDISGHENHGMLKNMSPNTQGSGWSGSKFGGGLKFDGTNDYVNCGNDASLNISEAITIGAWVKLVNTSNVQAVTRKKDSNILYFYTAAETEPAGLQLYLYGLSNPRIGYSIDNFNANEWYHVVGTYNGSFKKLYVDGVEVASDSASGSITTSIHNLAIGSNSSDLSQFFNGSIDDVHIYNRALLASEVKQLYFNPFCNLLQMPIRRYFEIAPTIMNQFQRANIGADLYNGAILA